MTTSFALEKLKISYFKFTNATVDFFLIEFYGWNV